MMSRIFSLILSFGLLGGCSDHDISTVESVQGEYEGIFYRTTPSGEQSRSKIHLTFTGDYFEGNSETVKYPAICGGDFNLDGKTITFKNTCVWTAEFDWTLILDGSFAIQREGERITMVKSAGTIVDTYVLERAN